MSSESQQLHRPTRHWLRVTALLAALAVALALVVPLVWPVPPLGDTVPYRELGGPYSQWIEVDGVEVHHVSLGPEDHGASADTTCGIVLIHGFGASVFSYRDVLPLFSRTAPTIAYDRPGFGITQRLTRSEWDTAEENPYGLTYQADQVIALMDAIGYERAVLVGHSAGAAVAVVAADRHPERVAALVLEDPAVFLSRSVSQWLRPILNTPQLRHIGPLIARGIGSGNGQEFLRRAYYDPDFVTPEVMEGYALPTRAQGWDVALWEFTIAPRPDDPANALARLEVPTLVVTGAEDRIIPYEDSVRTAETIPYATIITYEKTGHVPHEERPERFARDVLGWLDDSDVDCRSGAGEL